VPDLTDFAPTDGCVAPLQMPFLHDESISRRVGMLGGDVVTLAGLGIATNSSVSMYPFISALSKAPVAPLNRTSVAFRRLPPQERMSALVKW
ncbi:MAG TPA: hypothetical protein QF604_14140, partial [Candidatus Latescibacteria bacterium]|nr:hypothetical protein [Candidatus Latescibacterota bacterium]